MIGKTILHYEILEQICLPLGTIGEGGLFRRSIIETIGDIL